MMSSFLSEKEKFLNMPAEEKRRYYNDNQFFTVNDIVPWSTYFIKNKARLQNEFDKKKDEFVKYAGSDVIQPWSKINSKVALWKGDITKLEIDAIVNAANSQLLGGGGVDGAIHRAAGPLLKAECATLGGCPTGEAKITGGYKLPAKYVIHTVGPRGEQPLLLRQCYENSLRLLLENKLKHAAFPCISTGVYGYPQEAAANVALKTVRKFLEEHSDEVDLIIFTLFLDSDVAIYEKLMQVYFPV